ncbi:hypothetical protein FOL47_002583 [Perkinsus chesapeaki]|uniref:Uncharacterized protein n=1 Tax=Perkinsus chesapeaki TaxID=330153 RepID=A0A7J6MED7_PERCH|nr:hypothetical protein FOL47_002583 [Perkinsus chesapeaki]
MFYSTNLRAGIFVAVILDLMVLSQAAPSGVPPTAVPESTVAVFGGRAADIGFVVFIILMTASAAVAFGGFDLRPLRSIRGTPTAVAEHTRAEATHHKGSRKKKHSSHHRTSRDRSNNEVVTTSTAANRGEAKNGYADDDDVHFNILHDVRASDHEEIIAKHASVLTDPSTAVPETAPAQSESPKSREGTAAAERDASSIRKCSLYGPEYDGIEDCDSNAECVSWVPSLRSGDDLPMVKRHEDDWSMKTDEVAYIERGEWKPRLFPRASIFAAAGKQQSSSSGYTCSGGVRLRAREALEGKENSGSVGNVSVCLKPRRDLSGAVLRGRSESAMDGAKEWFKAGDGNGVEGTVSDGQLAESSANRAGGRVYYKGELRRGSTGVHGESEATSRVGKRRKRRRSRREKPSPRVKGVERPKRPKPDGMTARGPEVYRVDDGDTSACDSSPATSPVSGVPSIAEVMDSLGTQEDHASCTNSKGAAALKTSTV